jgi:hypothetical protein
MKSDMSDRISVSSASADVRDVQTDANTTIARTTKAAAIRKRRLFGCLDSLMDSSPFCQPHEP